MGMTFSILYHPEVVSVDIPALPKRERTRIQGAIVQKLASVPDVFGKPLRKSLKGYRRLRVGDYRVVFRIDDQQVIIFMIAHRSVVYDTLIIKRILW